MSQTTDMMVNAIGTYAQCLAETRRDLAKLRYETEKALDLLSRGSTRFRNTGPDAARIHICKVKMENAVETMIGLTDEEMTRALVAKISSATFPTIAADEIINGLKEKKNND